MNDLIKVSGSVSFKVVSDKGEVTYEETVPNLVVTVGKTFIASRMASAVATVMGYMAVGTSGTAPAITDTALGAEIARVALTSTTPSANTVQYVATFGAGVGTGSLQEAGIFDANTLGNMLCHTVFTTIPKGASDTLSVTWTITIS